LIRVRVRGIYATAISKILLDNGFVLSDASKKLKERLNVEDSPEPPHVTVKQSDYDVNEIVVIGFPEEAKAVYEALDRELPLAVRKTSVLNLHSSYLVSLEEDCTTTINGVKVKVKSNECYGGKVTPIEIVKAPLEGEAVAEEGYKVIGFYVEVGGRKQPRVTFSKHITNKERKAELMALSADIVAKGFAVHWRSSARNAPLEKLREELERLVDEAYKIEIRIRNGALGPLTEGEFLGIFHLTLEDKLKLDYKRNEVLPTMVYHHTLKSGGDKLSTAVELGDKMSPRCKCYFNSIVEFVREVIKDCKKVKIVHDRKWKGEIIEIGPMRYLGSVGDYDVFMRKVKEYGKYDGIDALKEPGDTILTFTMPLRPVLFHAYLSEDGDLKGIYYNINTGVEVGECFLRYLDLGVDVVKKENGAIEVIDEEELEQLPGSLKRYAKERVSTAKVLLAGGEVERIVEEARRILEQAGQP